MFVLYSVLIATVLLNIYCIPVLNIINTDTSNPTTKIKEYNKFDCQLTKTQTHQQLIKAGILIVDNNGNEGNSSALIDSARKNFLNTPGYMVKYFILSNRFQVTSQGPDIIELEKKVHSSPFQTHFRSWLENSAAFAEMDYLFAVQTNMHFEKTVGTEVLGDLVAVLHPNFHEWRRELFPYETRPESCAFVNDSLGLFYVHGPFYGGKKDIMLNMFQSLDDCIEKDRHRNIIAIRNDESYLNNYLVHHPPSILLNSV